MYMYLLYVALQIICRSYDEREFEDIGEMRAKPHRDQKKDRLPVSAELYAEAGSADDSDVQSYRIGNRGLLFLLFLYACDYTSTMASDILNMFH